MFAIRPLNFCEPPFLFPNSTLFVTEFTVPPMACEFVCAPLTYQMKLFPECTKTNRYHTPVDAETIELDIQNIRSGCPSCSKCRRPKINPVKLIVRYGPIGARYQISKLADQFRRPFRFTFAFVAAAALPHTPTAQKDIKGYRIEKNMAQTSRQQIFCSSCAGRSQIQ